MTIFKHTDEAGRSMVEMLGVLAIIGVLSVGGISGYSKAMAKYKLTKAQDQIVMLLMNVRTAYATSPSYEGLSSKTAGEYNLAPNEMKSGDDLYGTFGGKVTVEAVSGAVTYFHIKMESLGKEACRSLASSDWGADGLVMMAVNDAGAASCTITGGMAKTAGTGAASGGTGKWCVAGLPAKLTDVADACNNEVNYIDWVYY